MHAVPPAMEDNESDFAHMFGNAADLNARLNASSTSNMPAYSYTNMDFGSLAPSLAQTMHLGGSLSVRVHSITLGLPMRFADRSLEGTQVLGWLREPALPHPLCVACQCTRSV
jgi:hypothetical protein